MGCMGCGGARRMVASGVYNRNMAQVTQGVRQAGRVILEKARGTYNDANYANARSGNPPVAKAQPYRRPVERST